MATKKAVAVREKKDPRAIKTIRPGKERAITRSLQHEYHTINIAEQEGELPYVDVFISGTDKKGNPFARNFQIQRGVDVVNVPKMVVHVLMDTAIETRFRQQNQMTARGDKRNAFIPFKKSSYPCTIVESYDEKKELEDDDTTLQNEREADILIDES